MQTNLMHLKVLLPFETLVASARVSRIVAEGPGGSFGLLPQRLDCVAALVPGVLLYATASAEERLLAVDEGVLVKIGPDVVVSVRRAVRGTDLGQLRDAVEREFMTLDAHVQRVRSVMSALVSGLVSRLAEVHHG